MDHDKVGGSNICKSFRGKGCWALRGADCTSTAAQPDQNVTDFWKKGQIHDSERKVKQ